MKTNRKIIGSWDTAYWESDGTGKTVVLVHGNSSSKKIFTKQFSSDLAKQYRFIAPDLPGHGETSPANHGEGNYSVSICAEFLADFSANLNCEEIIFVGHSLGGHLILQGLQNLKEIASGIIIFGATPLANPPQTETAFLAHHIVPLLFQETLTDQERKNWRTCLLSSSGNPPDFYQTDIKGTDQKFRSSIGASLAANDFNDEIDVISALEIPIAILHGQDDQLINLHYLRNLDIPTLWRGKIEIIPNSGHTPQWEQPEKFNSLLGQFIKNSK